MDENTLTLEERISELVPHATDTNILQYIELYGDCSFNKDNDELREDVEEFLVK